MRKRDGNGTKNVGNRIRWYGMIRGGVAVCRLRRLFMERFRTLSNARSAAKGLENIQSVGIRGSLYLQRAVFPDRTSSEIAEAME